MKKILSTKLELKEGVCLIIPALNEEKTIEEIVKRCMRQSSVTQLVIINDGSTDRTKIILNNLARKFQKRGRPLLTIIHHSKNLGKGAAIKNGLKQIQTKYAMVQDADLEYFPEEIQNLLEKAKKSKNGIVFGSRMKSRKKGYLLAVLGNIYLNTMFNILFGFRLTDSYTCYKLMPKKIWRELDLKFNGFEIDAELISKLGMKKYKIVEIPISYNPRKYSEGKKICWKDLIKASTVAIRIRLSH